jgi:hypothetical protein
MKRPSFSHPQASPFVGLLLSETNAKGGGPDSDRPRAPLYSALCADNEDYLGWFEVIYRVT